MVTDSPNHQLTLRLRHLKLVESKASLEKIPPGKVLINTINANSYNTAQKDQEFAKALLLGDYLIPDGASIVKACRWLRADSRPKERIAGWDLFKIEMDLINKKGEKQVAEHGEKPIVMFMGSSEKTLSLIQEHCRKEYPYIRVEVYSPPYKPQFSTEDNRVIIDKINHIRPDLLWIGMTAPKQEKWAYQHWDELNISCHVGTIGAVFDFYAGSAKRAPQWIQENSLEWLYRLMKEPRRLWRRYILGNPIFLWNMAKEKWGKTIQE